MTTPKDKEERLTRIAIVNEDKCKPKNCNQECRKVCPVVKIGKLCVEVTSVSKVSKISEVLCIGCGICARECPYGAINIINIPKELAKETTHRYGANGFKLHRLPVPRRGQVLGLVGANGTGKSTAVKILGGKLQPNLGNFGSPPGWEDLITYFRGSELQNYFRSLEGGKLTAAIKVQYVDQIPQYVKGTVRELLEKYDERKAKEEVIKALDLEVFLDRTLDQLSGGELQRVAIALTTIRDVEIYIYDEAACYLDIYQRLQMARLIRSLSNLERYVLVIEHDLSILDYLSDQVCLLYGAPGAYGVITKPFGVREGINSFLCGFIPTENLRFRPEALDFEIKDLEEDEVLRRDRNRIKYPQMVKRHQDPTGKNAFSLTVEPGSFGPPEIIVLLGENGTGKTTFVRMLAGIWTPDNECEMPRLGVSYKPQTIAPKVDMTVRELLQKKIRMALIDPVFMTDVLKPLKVEDLYEQEVKELSGGELQRIAITLCLGTPADIYLLDESSSFLDSEQRLIVAKVIKRFILHRKATAFVVEHDFMMSTYLADQIILFEGTPGKECIARAPQGVISGMNSFLKTLDVTFRRDPKSHRPRINKSGSVRDREQKKEGTYFYVGE